MNRSTDQILDEWLVLTAQSGEPKALELLLKRWQPKMVRYARRQIKDKDSANDITQDTLLLVSRKLYSLKDPAAFPAWVYRILHRRCIDFVKKQARRDDGARKIAAEILEVTMGESEIGYDLHTAMQYLSTTHRQILCFHYLDGLNLEEIASVIDVPVGTVKSRLFNARKQLRQILTGETNE